MPKIIGGTLLEHREQTRERVFAALGSMLDTREFDDITFSAIAKEAGVGRTAMYNHFPDKDTLLVEYTLHATGDYIAELERSTHGIDSPQLALTQYIRTQMDLSVSLHMPANASRLNLAPQTAARMREHVVMIDEVLRRILVAGVRSGDFVQDLDIDSAIRIINALVIGKASQRMDPVALEAFIMRGLGAN